MGKKNPSILKPKINRLIADIRMYGIPSDQGVQGEPCDLRGRVLQHQHIQPAHGAREHLLRPELGVSSQGIYIAQLS